MYLFLYLTLVSGHHCVRGEAIGFTVDWMVVGVSPGRGAVVTLKTSLAPALATEYVKLDTFGASAKNFDCLCGKVVTTVIFPTYRHFFAFAYHFFFSNCYYI